MTAATIRFSAAAAAVCAALVIACGQGGDGDEVDTSTFDGEYELDVEAFELTIQGELAAAGASAAEMKAAVEMATDTMRAEYANFRVQDGVISHGAQSQQEVRFLATSGDDDRLTGPAIWDEAGQKSDTHCTLERARGRVWYMLHDEGKMGDRIPLKRRG